MKGIDSHCHIFNIVSVGLRALLEQLHETADLIAQDKQARATDAAAKSTKLKESIIDRLKKLIELVKIFTGDSEKILSLLDDHYKGEYQLFPLMFDGDFLLDSAKEEDLKGVKDIIGEIRQHLNDQKNKGFWRMLKDFFNPKKSLSQKELAILMDLLENVEQSIIKAKDKRDGFSIQYDHLVSIHKDTKYKNKVFPFLGVDPRREDIQYYLPQVGKDQLFAGLKIYAPNGFSPSDPRLDNIFKFCTQNHIPVIAHCSYGGFATPASNIDVEGYIMPPDKDKPVWHPKGEVTFTKSIDDGFNVMVRERARMLNHPKVWRKVLEANKGLLLVLAHFGENEDTDEWRDEICSMMHDFDNLYTDISCMSNEDSLKKVKAIFDNPLHAKLKGRILYGSDYFLDMFFNNSFQEYSDRIKGVFDNGSYEQISITNPQKFRTMWYS